MATTGYGENDVREGASLSRHFLSNESDVENDAFKNRVKQAMGGESTRAFARTAKISESVLRQYIKGESLPTLDRLIAIADTAKVNLLWLATGEGPMRGELSKDSTPCAGHVDTAALVRALTLVELVRASAPLERKAMAVAMAYDLLSDPAQPLDMERIQRLLEPLLKTG